MLVCIKNSENISCIPSTHKVPKQGLPLTSLGFAAEHLKDSARVDRNAASEYPETTV
jgi:hypothetical protein